MRLRDYEQNRRQPTQQKPQIKLELYGQYSADAPGQGQGMGSTPFGGGLGQAPGMFGSGGFGAPQQPSTGLFGAQPNPTPFGGTNAFGAPQQPPASGSVFGQTPPAPPFGQTQPQTGGLFGGGTAGGFGQPQQSTFGPTPTSTAPTFGGFGQQPQPTQTPGFGQTATSQPPPFGQTPGGFGGFGQSSASSHRCLLADC